MTLAGLVSECHSDANLDNMGRPAFATTAKRKRLAAEWRPDTSLTDSIAEGCDSYGDPILYPKSGRTRLGAQTEHHQLRTLVLQLLRTASGRTLQESVPVNYVLCQ